MPRPVTVFTASRRSQIAGLEALRDVLGRAIDECQTTKDLPPLASRHMAVMDQIEALRSEEKAAAVVKPVTARDEVRARREARLSGQRTG